MRTYLTLVSFKPTDVLLLARETGALKELIKVSAGGCKDDDVLTSTCSHFPNPRRLVCSGWIVCYGLARARLFEWCGAASRPEGRVVKYVNGLFTLVCANCASGA